MNNWIHNHQAYKTAKANQIIANKKLYNFLVL